MKKYHNKFKLTPEADKIIKNIAQGLPKVPLVDSHGKPVFHVDGKSELILGKNIAEGTANKPKKVDPEKKYRLIQTQNIMRYQNHYIALVDAWQKLGQAGIDSYLTSVKLYQKLRDEMIAKSKDHAR